MQQGQVKQIKIDQNISYEININEMLGEGSFGKVYIGYQINKENNTRYKVAAKVIDIQTLEKKGMKKNLINEIKILKDTKSPNIVEIIDVASTTNNVYIFLEFCAGGDLRSYLEKRGRLSQLEAISIFKQICNGFRALNEKKVLHRDIKPENILLNLQGIAKIADFGLSRILDNAELTSGVGTPKYKSPEMINNKVIYDSKIDVWSLGVTLYELIYGHTPWTGNTILELYNNVIQNNLQFDDNIPCTPSIKNLISKLLDKNGKQYSMK